MDVDYKQIRSIAEQYESDSDEGRNVCRRVLIQEMQKNGFNPLRDYADEVFIMFAAINNFQKKQKEERKANTSKEFDF